jgi:anti-sigma factor RsiW
MTCGQYEEQVSALIDHELKDEEAQELFVHLSTCRMCRRSLQSVLDLRSGLGEEVSPMAPKELHEKVLNVMPISKRFEADRKPARGHVWTRRISIPLPIAATITIILIAGSIAVTSLVRNTQTVYITAFPVVEVQGYTP